MKIEICKGRCALMKELLTMGDVTKDFDRLNVELRQTYTGDDYGVCEVTEEEFKILCDDPDEVKGSWEECGWRYCKGSNIGEANFTLKVNGEDLKCWYNPFEDDEEEYDEEIHAEDAQDDIYIPEYNDLLCYLGEVLGIGQPRNICALTKDLAKYNNMKLSELFKKYQG